MKSLRFPIIFLLALLAFSVACGAQAAVSDKPDRLLLIDETYAARDRMPPLLRAGLKKAGWKNMSFVEWKDLSPSLLHQARAIVIVGLPRRLDATDMDCAIAELLTDYVKMGGGLLLTQVTDQIPAAELTLFNLLARRFGTRILLEDVKSDPTHSKTIGAWAGSDVYTFTNRVFEPVNDGVKGVCYQSAVSWLALYGVLPFVPDAPWRVVLSAGPNSRSTVKPIGLEALDKDMRSAGFQSDVPLAGVRDFEKGRVAYAGMAANNIFARVIGNEEGAKTYETYMTKGWEGCPSNQLTFYLNMLRWVSAKADALAGAPLKLAAVKLIKRSTTWKLHRGVIGPRTIYSTGVSSPDEYVAKAKAIGLDFVVFLEDFASLKPSNFENLKADCRRLSTETFLALPGFSYQNTDGNHEYIFSDSIKFPSTLLMDRDGKRLLVYVPLDGPSVGAPNDYMGLHYSYGLLGFENTAGWYDSSHNPYPSYDARDVDSMAVVTQEGGKLLDRDVAGYAISNRSGQSLYPFALCLTKSAAELDGVKDGTCFFNLIGANGIDQIHRSLTSYDGRAATHLYPVVPPFGQTSISNGPVIELVMPGAAVDAQGDLYNKALQQWPLSLSVAAKNGLREIKILDGDTVVRRFLPSGRKTFSFKTSIPKERQKHLWVHVTAANGCEAISRAINCNSWIFRENQCADRNNQLLDSRQKRPDGSPFFIGYGGDTAMPDKGPWNGRIRPVGCFVLDQKLGVGAAAFDGSPEQHPQCWMNPCVMYDGKTPKSVGWLSHLVTDREGAPHVMPHRVVASSEVLIGDRVLDGVFPLTAAPVNNVWDSVYPVAPSKYLKTTGRTTFYLVKPDGVAFYLWDQPVELLQDVPTPASAPWFFHVGDILSNGGKQRIIVNAGKMVEQGDVKPYPLRTFAFNKGDYIGFLKHPFGSLAVYSLTDGLALAGDGVNFSVGIKPTGPVMKAGTKMRVRLLLAGMHNQVADPAALAARIRTDYGIAAAPSYRVKAQVGDVVSQQYALMLAASPEGCFLGSVRGIASLAGNLGCAVHGLNDRWTAWFQQGEKTKTRILPVEKGTAYAVLRDEDEGRDVFIGHPVVADQPELVLNVALAEDGQSWRLEVHNPTDQAVKSLVRSSPHVTGIRFEERMEIRPGTSLVRKLCPSALKTGQ
jgi:hypothetical protein